MDNLYHYTSVSGFESIVKNHEIRMTKSDFLNDPTDCHLFLSLIDTYLHSKSDLVEKHISSLKHSCPQLETIYKKGCDLTKYIKYLHKNISMYVLSLSKINDEMNMWNYYGQGGMELKLSTSDLVKTFRKSLASEEEYLTESTVIYANQDAKVEDIVVPSFSQFVLINKKSENLFSDNRKFISAKSSYEADQLYHTDSLDTFIDVYLKSYINSMKHLLSSAQICDTDSAEFIFGKIFNNDRNLNGFYAWKHDLSLYMLVLSSLIKSDSYKYEAEHRIVYFEYSTDSNRQKQEQYFSKHIAAGDFLCPYISFKGDQLLADVLQGVTVSPVTKNLPIDDDIYLENIKRFLASNRMNCCTAVKHSKHTIRW